MGPLLGLLISTLGTFAGNQVGQMIAGRDLGRAGEGGGGGGSSSSDSAEKMRRFAESMERQRREQANASFQNQGQPQLQSPIELMASAMTPPGGDPSTNQDYMRALQLHRDQLRAAAAQNRTPAYQVNDRIQAVQNRIGQAEDGAQWQSPLAFLIGRKLFGIGR